jgi:hypothetical protein
VSGCYWRPQSKREAQVGDSRNDLFLDPLFIGAFKGEIMGDDPLKKLLIDALAL